jgi:hypothetical protein
VLRAATIAATVSSPLPARTHPPDRFSAPLDHLALRLRVAVSMSPSLVSVRRVRATETDLRPLIVALMDFHPDLASIRDNSFHMEAYISTVCISVFCSLHGQGTTRITYNEMKGSNLVDAFELVSSQTTRNVRPFCVSYFEEIYSTFNKCRRKGACLASFVARRRRE